MNDAIEMRELFVLEGLDVVIRGTHHKTCDDTGGKQSTHIAQDRVGVVILNSTSPTRAANGDSAVYLADSFAACGYPSFRIDLPGFGDSDGNPPADLIGFINRGGFGAIASAKITELVSRFNLSGVVIMGHCAGSVSALYAAASSKECKGLVLIGPYFFLPQAKKPMKGQRKQSRLLTFAGKIHKFVEESRRAVFGDGLPENANYPLLRCWKKLAPRGLPILIFKGPERKTSSVKPKAAEFDYLEYVLKSAGRRSQVVVRVTEGANNAFANRMGRAAVREHSEQWLNACFPLPIREGSGADSLHRETVNSEDNYEDSKQCVKV